MIVNVIQCVSGIQRKQVNELENYKGVSIVSLKEEPNVLALQVKGNYYYGLGYFTLERAKACLDAMEGTMEEAMEREFNAAVKLKSPRISLGQAQYFNRLADWQAVEEYNQKLQLEQKRQEELEQQQRELEEQNLLQKSLALAADKFKQSQRISASEFLSLCKEHGIKLPLKTHGWIKAALYNISVEITNGSFDCNFQYYKGHKQSSVIDKYAIELYKKLTDEPIEATLEELEHLFGLTRTAAQ